MGSSLRVGGRPPTAKSGRGSTTSMKKLSAQASPKRGAPSPSHRKNTLTIRSVGRGMVAMTRWSPSLRGEIEKRSMTQVHELEELENADKEVTVTGSTLTSKTVAGATLGGAGTSTGNKLF